MPLDFWSSRILAIKMPKKSPFQRRQISFPFLDAPHNEEEEVEVNVTERAAFQIRQFQVRSLGKLLYLPEGHCKSTVSRGSL